MNRNFALLQEQTQINKHHAEFNEEDILALSRRVDELRDQLANLAAAVAKESIENTCAIAEYYNRMANCFDEVYARLNVVREESPITPTGFVLVPRKPVNILGDLYGGKSCKGECKKKGGVK